MSSPDHPEPFLSAAPAPPAPAAAEDPVWKGTDVVLIGLVALIAILAFSMVGIGVARLLLGSAAATADFSRDARIIVPVQAAAYLVVVGFMYALVARHYRRRFREAVRWNWPGGAWPGLVAGGAALAFAVQFASHWLPIPPQLPIDEYFRNLPAAYTMALFGIVLAPPVEELFFRGFLYPVLARRMGLVVAVVLTSLAFALIHATQLAQAWAPLALLFGVGVVLTLARAHWQSVAASTLVHVGYNLTLFTMVWFATDHFRHLEKLSQ